MKKPEYRFSDRYRIPDYDDPSQNGAVILEFDREKCRECGICIQVCPGGCIRTDSVSKMDLISERVKQKKYGFPRLQTFKRGSSYCIGCFNCGVVCPHGAISMKRGYNPGWHFKRLTQTSDLKYPKKY